MLKHYAFVYSRLINFPVSNITFEAVTSRMFFENVNRIIDVKIHAHHSHVTGKNLGYDDDFCN